MERIVFKYHPNAWKLGVFEQCEEGQPEVCQCCGKDTQRFLTEMYTEKDVWCICPECVSNGRATSHFDGEFVKDAEFNKVDNPDIIDELLLRTPGYSSWQGEYWLGCCNDFCAFLGEIEVEDLEELYILESAMQDYVEQYPRRYHEDLRADLNVMYIYLFKCFHCGKYRIWVEDD